jgi:hypothetical protein
MKEHQQNTILHRPAKFQQAKLVSSRRYLLVSLSCYHLYGEPSLPSIGVYRN